MVDTLTKRLLSLPPPPCWSSWSMVSSNPLILCKTEVVQASRVNNILTLSIRKDLKWTLFVGGIELSTSKCPLLTQIPPTLTSVAVVWHVVDTLNFTKVCAGNPEDKLLDVVRHRSQTLHGCSSKLAVYSMYHSSLLSLSLTGSQVDQVSIAGVTTVRHSGCRMLLARTCAAVRCASCVSLRETLMKQVRRQQKNMHNEVGPSSHVNYRYLCVCVCVCVWCLHVYE